ncbi:MAG TPA: hypothetical protein VFV75_07095 [Candidatus Polarisedimenticolaceae bacterium]|nr:hypothetical protein [Candidatus Polarisedimenticolaceae bacterium]
MRRAIILLAAAAAVATWSLATPALACDGHKADAAAVTAKAEEAKPAVETAAVKAEGGCDHAAKAAVMAAGTAAPANGVVKASAEGEGKAGCAKAKGCAKKGAAATAATVAKAEEPKAEEAKTK